MLEVPYETPYIRDTSPLVRQLLAVNSAGKLTCSPISHKAKHELLTYSTDTVSR